VGDLLTAESAPELSGRRGSRALLRDLNVCLLIEIVREHGPISRADLARNSRLSAATVSAITGRLLERGIFTEASVAPSSGGRPPVLLRLDPKAGYVVGVKLRGDGLTTVVCDLETTVASSTEAHASLMGHPEAVIPALEQAVRQALRAAGVTRKKVLGIGIGLSGVIDSEHGICRFSHLLGWENVAITAPLRRRLRMPVWVENDVKALAIAEKWAGDGMGAKNFVTLSVGRGIGLGIVVNRMLYRGAAGGAGELGHITIDPGGPRCECGRTGCLEAFAGEPALLRAATERLGEPVDHDKMMELIAAGDETVEQVLAEAGRILGTAVANVITLFNPELLIVSGEGTELGDAFLAPVTRAVRAQTFAGLGRDIPVKIQRWGNEAWAVGAATLVLREMFSLPGSDRQGAAIWHETGAE
jgi:N-acetylglucosamine repressor